MVTTAGIISGLGLSHPMIMALLAGIVANGGVYGPYTVRHVASGGDSKAQTTHVAAVRDGDTVELEGGTLVRLAEINAPELKECGGVEAKDALQRLVLGKDVYVEKDIDGQDDFARLIRFLVVDMGDPRRKNVLAQEYLLEKGFARYTPGANKRYVRELEHAVGHAQTTRAGIWKDCAKDEADRAALEKSKNLDEHVPAPNAKCTIKGNISENGYGKQ